MGRFDREGNDGNIPQYIKEVRKTLKNAYDVIRVNLDVAHKKRKDVKDKHCAETNFRIGDRVWLFNPAVKVGQTKKFSSLWRGPYTVIDRVSPVNYRIGTTSTQIVHYNRLKLCHGDPEKCTMSRGSEQTTQLERDEVL